MRGSVKTDSRHTAYSLQSPFVLQAVCGNSTFAPVALMVPEKANLSQMFLPLSAPSGLRAKLPHFFHKKHGLLLYFCRMAERYGRRYPFHLIRCLRCGYGRNSLALTRLSRGTWSGTTRPAQSLSERVQALERAALVRLLVCSFRAAPKGLCLLRAWRQHQASHGLCDEPGSHASPAWAAPAATDGPILPILPGRT